MEKLSHDASSSIGYVVWSMHSQIIVRGLLLFAMLGQALPAWACEGLLTASRKRVYSEFINVPSYLSGEEDRLQTLLDHNEFFVIREHDGLLWTMGFDPNPKNLNQAYYLELREKKKNQFQVTSITRASVHEERDYFHRVASMNGITSGVVRLESDVLSCTSVFMDSWVMAKLWLKHKLNPSDVREVLNGRHGPPVRDQRNSVRDPRFKIHGRDSLGRKILIVLAHSGACPVSLVTAYEVGH